MKCRHIEPRIVDLARGVTSPHDARLAHHVLGCPSCAGLLERERVMSAALRRLAEQAKEPAPDPRREEMLLAILDDRRRPQPGRHLHAARWSGLAAAAACVAFLTWHLASVPSPPAVDMLPREHVSARIQQPAFEPADRAVPVDMPALPPVRAAAEQDANASRAAAPRGSDFVLWPDAAAWPPFESGEIVRIDVPIDALTPWGFVPAPGAGVVQADVLVGQDGFARAIRFVQ
jgi:hypothetical protein